MLFIKRQQNSIWIPKHNSYKGPFVLELTHNITGKKTEFENLKNEGSNSGYYIFLGLDFRTLESGEHTYRLINENGYQMELGLLQVMHELTEPISVSYKKKTNKITYNG